MNTARNLLRATVGIFVSGVFAAATLAGPGPDYWRHQGKAPGTTTSTPAAPTPEGVAVCTDARLVSVTETKFIQANGRGPMRSVEVGKKLVCTSCETPMIAMKPSGHNGRGAMAPVAIKGTHDCTKNGCRPAATVARVD